jgi:hypothetical protein
VLTERTLVINYAKMHCKNIIQMNYRTVERRTLKNMQDNVEVIGERFEDVMGRGVVFIKA